MSSWLRQGITNARNAVKGFTDGGLLQKQLD